MSEFLAAYPDYATTSRLDNLRAAEYSYLDAGGHTYLDYTGAGLAADAQLRARAAAARRMFRQPALGEPDLPRVHRAHRAGPGGGTQLFQRVARRIHGHLHAERHRRVPPGPAR